MRDALRLDTKQACRVVIPSIGLIEAFVNPKLTAGRNLTLCCNERRSVQLKSFGKALGKLILKTCCYNRESSF